MALELSCYPVFSYEDDVWCHALWKLSAQLLVNTEPTFGCASRTTVADAGAFRFVLHAVNPDFLFFVHAVSVGVVTSEFPQLESAAGLVVANEHVHP